MYDNQKQLRAQAFQVMEECGRKPEALPGTGGARLSIDSGEGIALVRTSSNREVGWMRNPETGAFKGFDDKADITLVATFDKVFQPTCIEVYAFDPEVMKEVFRSQLTERLKTSPALAKKAPIFVPLDDKGRGAALKRGLKHRALWKVTRPLGGAATVQDDLAEDDANEAEQLDLAKAKEGFAARVRREFAELVGLPAEAVQIELRIVL